MIAVVANLAYAGRPFGVIEHVVTLRGGFLVLEVDLLDGD